VAPPWHAAISGQRSAVSRLVAALETGLDVAYICIMMQMTNQPPGLGSCGACCEDLRTHMQTGLFKALCDANRVAILADLAAAGVPRTVGQIAEPLPVDLSVVSRHLAVLREAGVLAANKRGKEVYYTVRYQGLAGSLRAMAAAIDACCPAETAAKEDMGDG
jgi:ArsR family transcriptional regulator